MSKKKEQKEKTVEELREEFLAREAEAMKEWTQPTEFEPLHNAAPWMDDVPQTENLDLTEGETETNDDREAL